MLHTCHRACGHFDEVYCCCRGVIMLWYSFTQALFFKCVGSAVGFC